MASSSGDGRAEAERLAQEQAALRRVATLVACERPPAEIFAKVAEEVGLLFDGDAALIQRYDPDGYAAVVGSWGQTLPVGSRWTLDEDGVAARVHRTQRPARVVSYEHAPGALGAHARKLGMGSAVGSPIVVNGQLWGVIGAVTSGAEPMPADTESRLAQFTELLATAIANVQARADLAASRARIAAAAYAERRRVVRDLHDGAQQRLVHIMLTLKLAQRAIDQGRPDASALLDEAIQHAQTATDELRELAHGILPAVLTDAGLGAGVSALASRTSIPVEIDVLVDRLPPVVEATAYFIVAEALTNAAKHAHAQRATVRANLENGSLQLVVRDDGVGGARADGNGLVGLSDRLAAVGGTLRIESPADGGTLIAASIPVR